MTKFKVGDRIQSRAFPQLGTSLVLGVGERKYVIRDEPTGRDYQARFKYVDEFGELVLGVAHMKIGDQVRVGGRVYEILSHNFFTDSYLLQELGTSNRVEMSADVLISREVINTPKNCSHTWSTYVGFTQTYEYCTKCDEKNHVNKA